jgi:hypothetical protein
MSQADQFRQYAEGGPALGALTSSPVATSSTIEITLVKITQDGLVSGFSASDFAERLVHLSRPAQYSRDLS